MATTRCGDIICYKFEFIENLRYWNTKDLKIIW